MNKVNSKAFECLQCCLSLYEEQNIEKIGKEDLQKNEFQKISLKKTIKVHGRQEQKICIRAFSRNNFYTGPLTTERSAFSSITQLQKSKLAIEQQIRNINKNIQLISKRYKKKINELETIKKQLQRQKIKLF